MSNSKARKERQRTQRKQNRREEMLERKNAFNQPDPTPYEAVKRIKQVLNGN